jgi:hypothetical protein
MTRTYNEPEFKAVKMISEDVLTASTLDDLTSGWETGSNEQGGGTVPILTL